MSDNLIIGIDEAGRGPLAGNVFAAAVLLGSIHIEGLTDSKKLTAIKREQLTQIIHEKSIRYSVAQSSVEEIDEINILNATLLAMNRALDEVLEALSPKYKDEILTVIIDGNRIPESLKGKAPIYYKNFKLNVISKIKGDLTVPAVSAASIIAKTSRDSHILQLHEIVPEYRFDLHKGYGTAKHIELIEKYGPSKFHRKSFNPVRSMAQKTLF